MPVILFIIDNSASMNQVTYLGTSYLDLAKTAVENFLKIRSRDPMNARNDRYMLLTLDEPPSNIKVGWKEHLTFFTNALKNLKATGLTNINPVLKQAFDLLNLNRLSSGLDTFGLGRCPFYFETSLIVFITDGGQLMNMSSTYNELNLQLTNSPLGSELVSEPFRWDQRFFLISLNMGSVPAQDLNTNVFIPSALNSPINSMCDVTGGRSYLISSQRMLFQCLESLVAKIQAGVVINFEKYGNDPPPLKGDDEIANQILNERMWEKCRKMILIPRNPVTKGFPLGHWPIPECYWISLNSSVLPKRNAHPLVKFKCEPCEPMCIEEIPFDRYDLEPSHLTQFILERRQPNVAWQCFVPNSGSKSNDLGFPFGYIKPNSNMMGVSLYVLPYNYPLLFQLITELFQILKLKPTKEWTDKFDMYLKHIPPYYYGPLRRVLSKKGLQHLIAENMENCLSPQVQSYLKKIKNLAKVAFDQVCGQPTLNIEAICLLSSHPNSLIFKRQQTDNYAESKEFNNWLQSLVDTAKGESIRQQFTSDFTNFMLRVRENRKPKGISFKDPAEIPRHKLIETLQKMRTNFLYKCKNADEDELHSVRIQDMGNYHEYLKNQTPPLRELEAQMVRQHMFGNPFKLVSKDQKTSLFGADEIDEVYEESTENNQQFQQQKLQASITQQQNAGKRGPGSKRRSVKGPLSKRINYLKNLFNSSNSGSSAGSTIGDSDLEIADDLSSVASGSFTSTEENSQFGNIDKSTVAGNNDVANLNDFNEFQPLTSDMEVQSLDSNKQVSFNFESTNLPKQQESFQQPQQQQQRPQSAVSTSSTLSNEMSEINIMSSSCLCDNYLEQSYIQLKILCIEQIKRPGNQHHHLFQLIQESHLTIRMRIFLIRELVYEASRFKRNKLTKLLNKYSQILTQIMQINNTSNNDANNNLPQK